MTTAMRQVEIPHDYFYKMSKKDYSNFEQALVREFFQNSYDAGAKQFVVDFDKDNGVITIFDDGGGMDYDTIVNKLLVMGMSHKTSDTAVGAFGHAKILLYFSWEKWEIRTKNYLVTGSSHYYTIDEVDDYVDGTISTIYVDKKVRDFDYWVRDFFTYCDTNCNVHLVRNGAMLPLTQSYQTTEQIYDGENYNIFKSTQTGHYIIIRQNGVFMFKEWIHSNRENVQAVVEINKKPDQVFLQNRDYFNSAVADHFNKIKQQFSIDSVETFTMNHSTNQEYREFNYEITRTVDDKPTTVLHRDVLTHGMDTDESKKELDKKRTMRLVAIAYSFCDMINNGGVSLHQFKIGITKSPTCHGRYRRSDGFDEIYFNINSIIEHSPNYRKMAVFLLNILKHELAHGLANEKFGEATHNENFVKCYDLIHDTFWDTIPFITKFKEIWKECGK
jgi:hypothetical protein